MHAHCALHAPHPSHPPTGIDHAARPPSLRQLPSPTTVMVLQMESTVAPPCLVGYHPTARSWQTKVRESAKPPTSPAPPRSMPGTPLPAIGRQLYKWTVTVTSSPRMRLLPPELLLRRRDASCRSRKASGVRSGINAHQDTKRAVHIDSTMKRNARRVRIRHRLAR